MTDQISDTRLRRLINFVYNEFLVDNVKYDGAEWDDIHNALQELLDLRKQKAELEKELDRMVNDWSSM